MKTSIFAAFAIAFAAQTASAQPETFEAVSKKTVNGETHIKAVNGDRTANVRVSADGNISGTIDGKPVKVFLVGELAKAPAQELAKVQAQEPAKAAPALNNQFRAVSETVVNGETLIKAVRLDGKQTANLRITKAGLITAEVEGRPVKAVLKTN
ncbi:MAG: hypothetical protein E6R12_08260 [Sphingomonadales bacterium]|nr:MAG: hypothetical protein E6R12_08260 [Sphingomonadales bacterium]